MLQAWHVVLTQPQQEIATIPRLHWLGVELFVPVIRKRVPSGHARNGKAITRLVARPMFPGYGFVQQRGDGDLDAIRRTRGVFDLLRTANGNFAILPREAVEAIFEQQQAKLREFLKNASARGAGLAAGMSVKVKHGVYTGMVATIDRVDDSKGRIEVLFGMIRHSMPAQMVCAA